MDNEAGSRTKNKRRATYCLNWNGIHTIISSFLHCQTNHPTSKLYARVLTNGIFALVSAHAAAILHWDHDLPSLKVDADQEHEHSGEEVGEIWEVLPIKGETESLDLVRTGEEQVEEGPDASLELGARSCCDGGGREGAPEDGLADMRGNK